MPCFMNSNLIPSLKCQSLVKVGVLLWENKRDASLLADFHFKSKTCQGKHKEWQRVEDKILVKATALGIPEVLHKKLKCFIRLIGMEIMKWKENQLTKITYSKEFLRASIVHLSWTPYGTVDVKKTAKIVVNDENLDICKRYDMACMNCLEEDIYDIWKKLSKSEKKLYTEYKYCRLGREELIRTLIRYWTCTVRGSLNDEEKSMENDFEFIIAVESGNKAAVEYFWMKMRSEIKKLYFSLAMRILSFSSFDEMISPCCFKRISYNSDIACFLLSHGPEEKPKDLIENGRCLVSLRFLLDWPHQSSFFEFSNHVWEAVALTDFEHIARYIIHKINHGYKDCDYSELFRELWKNCPISYRKSFVRHYTLQRLLPPFFKIRDRETLSLIFKNVSSKRRMRAILHVSGRNICIALARHRDWNLLSYFIKVSLKWRENVISFRDQFFSRRMTRSSLKNAIKGEEDITAKIYRFLSRLAHYVAKKEKCVANK